MTIVKTFGIRRTYKGRYAVTTDISEDLKYYDASDTMTYAKPDFALRQAEQFVRSCYKDFINFQGVAIHFEYQNMGLIA